MALCDVRAVYLPYCIERQSDGRYVFLNREYKPVGMYTKDLIHYEKYPVSVRLAISSAKIKKMISWDDDSSTERIYLYGDRTNPILSEANMDAYLEKLKFLARLEIPLRDLQEIE